jgi:hypothetical protein
MSEPIEERGCQLLVAKNLRPLSEVKVGRHYVEYAEKSSSGLILFALAKLPVEWAPCAV